MDTKIYRVKGRIPMPNQGDSHGGSFISYTVWTPTAWNGSARAAEKDVRWVAGAR